MAVTHRPWTTSFSSAIVVVKNPASVNTRALDQVHKLARNLAVSIDIGCSNMVLVEKVDQGLSTAGLSGKYKYLIWVKSWKLFYVELSGLIRWAKKNLPQEERAELLRLKETAQVMLNARRVGKLASWAIVERQRQLDKRLNKAA